MLHQILHTLSLSTQGQGFTDITAELNGRIAASGLATGIAVISCLQTSCSLIVNENADPLVLNDLADYLKALVPEDGFPKSPCIASGCSMRLPMLIGAELLAKVKELGDASKADLVRGAGYASNGKDGRERLNFTAFYEALLEAKGVHLGDGVTKAGRKLNNRLTVQANGAITVSKGYTALMDLKPGDALEIKVGRKQLRLVALDAPAEEAGEVDAPQVVTPVAVPVSVPAVAPVATPAPSGVYGESAAA